MKTQMRFQKILMTASLVIAALAVVYALIFNSGLIYNVGFIGSKAQAAYPDAYDVFTSAQGFSDTFLILGIVLILTVVFMYAKGCNSRRKYYITNYIACGIAIGFALIVAILMLVQVINVQGLLANMNLQQMQQVYETDLNSSFGEWTESKWVFALGYVYVVLLVCDAVVIGLNLLWKIKLMQGEKALLEQGAAKEVA